MTYINNSCADAGTVNCPCPLAETGDCLICGRLSGKEQCDCTWAGLCIYNEFVHNGKLVKNQRQEQTAEIIEKKWYKEDLLVLVLKVPKGFALNAANPGSFVFLKAIGQSDAFNVPVSVMKVDMEKGRLHLLLKVISAKTKRIAAAEESLLLRGVYRNGLLGEGVKSLAEDLKQAGGTGRVSVPGSTLRSKWLILTKGVGFAPAVNLLLWAAGRVEVEMVIDTEKITQELVEDYLHPCPGRNAGDITIKQGALFDYGRRNVDDYDKVILLASDYYIKTIAKSLAVPADKLVCSNNFHMCCGEGICGACSHTAQDGTVSRMCKCRLANLEELR